MKKIITVFCLLSSINIIAQVEVQERNEWGDIELREKYEAFTITINDYRTKVRIVKLDSDGKTITEIYDIKSIDVSDDKAAHIHLEYEYDANKRFLITINLFKSSAFLVYNGKTDDIIEGNGFSQNLIK